MHPKKPDIIKEIMTETIKIFEDLTKRELLYLRANI
jgi:hypothetical protein